MTVFDAQRLAVLIDGGGVEGTWWSTGSKVARRHDHQLTVAEKRAVRGAA